LPLILTLGMTALFLGCKLDSPAAVKQEKMAADAKETDSSDSAILEDDTYVDTKPMVEKLPEEDKVEEVIKETKSTSTPKVVKKEIAPKVKPQKKHKPKPRSKIEFDNIKYDFGEIIQGDTVDYKFIFKNTGKGPLVINSAKATCGCTQPSFPFIPIEAGEEGHIGVRYVSIGKEGLQKPLITVYTNASKEPINLMMKGKVNVVEDEADVKQQLEAKQDTTSK